MSVITLRRPVVYIRQLTGVAQCWVDNVPSQQLSQNKNIGQSQARVGSVSHFLVFCYNFSQFLPTQHNITS